MADRKFQAGDRVEHGPSGEIWRLACDEALEAVSACGWPDSKAQAADCTLIKPATPEGRLAQLKATAKVGQPYLIDDYSWRRSHARDQLRGMGEAI